MKPYTPPPPLIDADNRRTVLTNDQRRVRHETALHEGTHLGVALALGGSGRRAFIRVPGKAPRDYWGHSGRHGSVAADHDEPFEHGCIMLAGLVAEAINPDGNARRAAARGDIQDFEEHAKKFQRSINQNPLDFDAVLRRAFEVVTNNWAGIDAIAAGLLQLGRNDGVVTRKKVSILVGYFNSRQWTGRDTLCSAPSWDDVSKLRDDIWQNMSK